MRFVSSSAFFATVSSPLSTRGTTSVSTLAVPTTSPVAGSKSSCAARTRPSESKFSVAKPSGLMTTLWQPAHAPCPVSSSTTCRVDRLSLSCGGFAAAFGHEIPSPEDWLLAIAYLQENVLAFVGTTSRAVVEALRVRDVRVPESDPPVFQPMRDVRDADVAEEDLSAVIERLRRQHPPGSEWRWGFNWTDDDPRRARIIAEGGIDLEEIIADARTG